MMCSQLMNLPLNIPWQLIKTSPDMMDVQFCNKKFPFRWRTSLAIYAYEPKPEDLPDEVCDQITYLKIATTITGYQEDWRASYTKALGEVIRQWYPDTPVEELDDLTAVTADYWACYGVQLQVAVFPNPYTPPSEGSEFPSDFNKYPHIVDFQPKIRDLYQTTTESGEILSGSHTGLNTDKTAITTETTETGISAEARFGIGPVGGGAKLTHSWGETDQDSRSVQTEASRERRELYGTTTNISQMYNLLTGYHSGTNRAVFLMLPRPHILQPTDRRTFVQGLRYIEGVQEFFLVVARPREVEGLCVEAILETSHLPEDVQINETPSEYEPGEETYVVEILGSGDFSRQFSVESGWVIDRAKGDRGHPGVTLDIERQIGTLYPFEYYPSSETELKIEGKLSHAVTGRGTTVPGEFTGYFTIHKHRMDPLLTTSHAKITTPYIITARSLLACLKRGENCIESTSLPASCTDLSHDLPVPHVSVVDENEIKIPSLLIREDVAAITKLPAMKELLRQIQFRMASSPSSFSRYPSGEVGFFDSNYFIERIVKLAPKELSAIKIKNIKNLPSQIIEALGSNTSIGDALKLNLQELTQRVGLEISDTVRARRTILNHLIQTNPPKRLKTPNLVNMPLDQARKTLKSMRLKLGDVAYQDSNKPRDTVINQYPNPGKVVSAGTQIDLVLASGTIELPDVIGKSLMQALNTLRDAALEAEPKILFAPSEEQPENHVLEMTPEAGAQVTPNTGVVLQVSSGQSQTKQKKR